ncbi:NAD(P)-binding protein [Coniochaeta sp. PMI_546]|nr:NAD(P)-binding protein [Coniochaeta sp. PMI_546]
MPFSKIVVAGSSGRLADQVLPVILSSTEPRFDVTILTRSDSGKSPSLPGAKLVRVDYNDHASLVRAVTGADAILSLVSSQASQFVDQSLLKAALEAGVRRIFTSEYTLDVLHPAAVSLFTGGSWPDGIITPVLGARKFADLAEQGGPTSFTTLMSSAFIDQWLEGAFGIFDPKGRKVTTIDGGNHFFTGCSAPFIGECIVAALKMDEEKTRNRRIPIAEVRTTMNEVVRAYEKVTGHKFETVAVTSEELLATRDGALKAGNLVQAVMITILVAAFGGKGAGDLKNGLLFDGDGYLVAQRKSLERLVADAVRKVDGA